METFVVAVARSFEVSFFTACWVFVALWGVETLWPRGERPTLSQMLKALRFWGFFIVIGALIAGAFDAWRAVYRVAPLLDAAGLARSAGWAAFLVGPVLFLILYDFFNYWMHRAQHRWFWRQHRVHHSITNLSSMNSYFHPTEHLFRVSLIYLPMALLFGWGASGMTVVASIVMALDGFFVHSPSRLNFGPLRHLFVDNAFHRIHHSVEERHFERNFGAFTTIWDRLFRTAHFPVRDEWPDTGIVGFAEPVTVMDYVMMRAGAVPGSDRRQDAKTAPLPPGDPVSAPVG